MDGTRRLAIDQCEWLSTCRAVRAACFHNGLKESTLRGVVFTGNRTVEIRDYPDPEPRAGEAIIQVRASGLCGTDLQRYRSADPKDMITGHEPCGEILALGPGSPTGFNVGDRVMVHHYYGCGACEFCAAGWEQLCPQGRMTYGGGTAHGANAEKMLVLSRTLVHLPAELSFEAGATLSCSTGTAWKALKRIDVSGHDTVVVFGQGPLGLSGTLCAKAMGARVIAVDVNAERLKIATTLGADEVVDPTTTDPVGAVRAATHGHGATAALETSGHPEARARVLECLRPFARCCYVGVGPATTIDIDRDLIFKVGAVFGSWTFSKSELVEAARFAAETQIPLDQTITHRYQLEQAAAAFAEFDAGSAGKSVFIFD